MSLATSRKRKFRRAAASSALLPGANPSLETMNIRGHETFHEPNPNSGSTPASTTATQAVYAQTLDAQQTLPRPAYRPLMLHAAVLSLALLVGAGGIMVHARQPRADAPNMQAPLLTGQIGSVDIERVYVASGGPEQLAQRATEVATEVTQRFNQVKGVSELDPNELSEYGTLLFRATRTEADEARLKALKALSDQRVEELNRLQIKPDNMLTAEDKTRMRQLQEQSRQFAALLPNWQEDLRGQQTERIEAFRRAQFARLRPLVGKAAQERGIAHVFDTTSLVYSANDLTPVLVQRVGKRASKDKDAKDAKDANSKDVDVKNTDAKDNGGAP